MKDKIIVALDVDTRDKAVEWVKRLKSDVGCFKVGKQLFTSTGPEVVRKIKSEGAGIFLDLKFHDIPNTVAAASIEAVRLGVDMFNVHALGGYEMMARSADAVRDEAERLAIKKPVFIAVTVLTSMSDESLREAGILTPAADEVRRLALLAKRAGMDGVVASPREIRLIKEACGGDFIVVTPGVRTSLSASDDQVRVMTPGEASRAGADYLVIGRPITKAADPVAAVKAISEAMCPE
ncbi:MAG: orotidine-5'-phosphate decarboxylase [bacterium]|nr:orotidine-5'-phosphate decarboxylase [bacterium]